MANCLKCGSKLGSDERFCANCGSPVTIIEPTSFDENFSDIPGFSGYGEQVQETRGFKQSFEKISEKIQNVFQPLATKIGINPKILMIILIGIGIGAAYFVLPHGGSSCGNDICDVGEDFNSCPYDCIKTSCGDGNCTGNETFITCPVDCKKSLGENCTQDEKCISGHCVHGICRLTDPYCNDTYCDNGETSVNCPFDCGECGNEICDPGETEAQCLQDCMGLCGNHVCNIANGENTTTCPLDCAICGNGICELTETKDNCLTDCKLCGNKICDPGENLYSCAQDCASCGDRVCTAGVENSTSCPKDCSCGNKICESKFGETSKTCFKDCHCGDGKCQSYESTKTCPKDCRTVDVCNEKIVENEDECGEFTCGAGGECIDIESIWEDGEEWLQCGCRNSEICGDNIDNDQDGSMDCRDSSCSQDPLLCSCGSLTYTKLDMSMCNYGYCPEQSDCINVLPADVEEGFCGCFYDVHLSEQRCSNGQDDNGNGLIDCNDEGCCSTDHCINTPQCQSSLCGNKAIGQCSMGACPRGSWCKGEAGPPEHCECVPMAPCEQLETDICGQGSCPDPGKICALTEDNECSCVWDW